MTDSAITRRLGRLLGAEVIECRGIGGQHGAAHYRVTLVGGQVVFAKVGREPSGSAGLAAEGLAADGLAADGSAADGSAARGVRGRGARAALAA